MGNNTMQLNRRSFLKGAGAGVAGVAMVAAGAGVALADEPTAPVEEAAPSASTSVGMTFTGNEGKTMGEVLGAGWLGEEPEISDDEITEVLETEIVVCGAGHSGTACARKAAELGADVIVCERQLEENFSVLGNDIGHLNSNWQTELHGIPVYNPADFINEFQICCANRAQPTLVSQFANRSGEAFDWFIDNFTADEKANITCLTWPAIDGYNYKKGMFTSYVGSANFQSMSDDVPVVSLPEALIRTIGIAEEAGAKYYFGMEAVRLVHNDDGTEVTGVIFKNEDGGYTQVNARAIVLACGDIGSNIEMYDAICSEDYALGEYKDTFAFSGRDGSGIAMGLRIGAKVEIGTGGDMAHQVPGINSPLQECETLWLNSYGKRFCNEAYGGPLLSKCSAGRLPGDTVYSIWDANWYETLMNQNAAHMSLKNWDDATIEGIAEDLENAIGTGAEGYVTSEGKLIYCADTLEELGSYIGMSDPVIANMIAAVNTWNAAADAGVDLEFGRAADMIWPLVNPPYYAFSTSCRCGGGAALCSTSGLLVTADQQVQGQGYRPIKGLYATGNNSGGRFAMGYNGIMNGVSVGMALTLGMCLGEFLATGDLDAATDLI